MNEEAYGLKQHVIEEIIDAARAHGIHKLILFGSRAKNRHSRASDIDLAVYGGDAAGFAAEAEESVQTLLRFDITDMSGCISPDFRRQIEEGIVLYEKI